jgi:SAM-dependent methyltransferase
MYSDYSAIASVYDKINSDIDYSKWADFIEACFDKFLATRPELILDLACGTGSMTFELQSRGYDMIGADGSEDMLSEAYEKAYDKGINNILFLRQDMRSFELYGTVGAVCCCLDSINYLTKDGDLDKCFSTVHNYLDPDGLFIFDVNSPYKFSNVYGNNHYIFETEDSAGNAAYCGWQNCYDEATKLCTFDLSVFTEREDGRYDRSDEQQTERCYSMSEIKDCLNSHSLEVLGVYADYDMSAPEDETERWYFVAKANK